MELSTDDRRAVSFSRPPMLRAWDLNSRRCLHALGGHQDQVTAVSLSADRRHALSASMDETLRVCDLDSGRCLHALEGHQDSVEAVRLSAGSRHAVSFSDDSTLRVWDLQTGEQRACFTADASFRALAASATESVLVAGDALGRVHILRIVEPVAPTTDNNDQAS